MGVAALSDKYQVPTLQHFGSTWIGEHWTVESDAQIYMSGLRHPGSEPQGEQCLQLIDTHARDALTHLHVLQDKTIDAILSREGLCILEHELVDTLLAWVEQSKKSVESVMSMLFKHSLKLLQCTGNRDRALCPLCTPPQSPSRGTLSFSAPHFFFGFLFFLPSQSRSEGEGAATHNSGRAFELLLRTILTRAEGRKHGEARDAAEHRAHKPLQVSHGLCGGA